MYGPANFYGWVAAALALLRQQPGTVQRPAAFLENIGVPANAAREAARMYAREPD